MRHPDPSTSKSEEARQRGAEPGAAEEGPSNWSCSHTAQSPEELQQGGKRGTKKYFALPLPSSCSLLPEGKAAQGVQSCPTEVPPRGRKQGRGLGSMPGVIRGAYGEYPASLSEPYPTGGGQPFWYPEKTAFWDHSQSLIGPIGPASQLRSTSHQGTWWELPKINIKISFMVLRALF